MGLISHSQSAMNFGGRNAEEACLAEFLPHGVREFILGVCLGRDSFSYLTSGEVLDSFAEFEEFF
jgi:hypothetical protein